MLVLVVPPTLLIRLRRPTGSLTRCCTTAPERRAISSERRET
jgi:hypothetical protein